MKFSHLQLLVPFLLGSELAGASYLPRDANTPTTTLPACQQVSASASVTLAGDPNATPTVSAQLAYDCLTSVPLNAGEAIALVESLFPYVEWESDISYLASPPSTYLMPAIDINASLNTLITNIKSNLYPNEYSFQSDLLKLFQSVHNGHFRFAPDLVSKALQFRRPVGVVSVSKDGVEIPQIYVRGDMEDYVQRNGTSMPSVITEVNGQEVIPFMQNLANLGFLQDPDALWNNLFYQKAFDAGWQRYTGFFALAGRFGYFYPGSTTNLTFANGTTNTYTNYAEVIRDFTNITDGNSMYETFCTGPHIPAQPDNPNITFVVPVPPPLPPTDLTPANGYPTPQIISSDRQASGYFLEGTGYEDVAVLSFLSFEPSWPVEFQSVIETFIGMARKAGKTKMVIDLSSNGGGIILTGYDAFRQFFPNITQDGFSRFRQHDAFSIIAKQISNYSSSLDPAVLGGELSNGKPEDFFAWQSSLNWRYDLNESDAAFGGYNQKFGPKRWGDGKGGNFTELMRWNLDDVSTTSNPLWGLGETITGYGNRKNFTQPFAKEDIILLYDGYCASTCNLFSEFMRVQGGVRSVVMGGRPTTSAIQAIGGTKGANNYPFGYIRQLSRLANETSTDAMKAGYKGKITYSDLPINRSTDTSINVRDAIERVNLVDGTPAQFKSQLADCRLFWEPGMVVDVRNVWKKVADAAWGGQNCVAGGFTKRETREERLKRSGEMKIRARREWKPTQKRTIDVAMYVGKQKNPELGTKVPL